MGVFIAWDKDEEDYYLWETGVKAQYQHRTGEHHRSLDVLRKRFPSAQVSEETMQRWEDDKGKG